MNTSPSHNWLNDPESAGISLNAEETQLAQHLLALAEGARPTQGFVSALEKELAASPQPALARTSGGRGFLRFAFAAGAFAALALAMMFIIRLLPGGQPAAQIMETSTLFTATGTPTPAVDYLPIENALAQAILGEAGRCEWETLGNDAQTGQQYVWAYCETLPSGASAGSMPAVIQWSGAGQIIGVSLPQDGTEYAASIRRLFPVILHERVFNYSVSEEMGNNLRRRQEDPSLPPLAMRPHPAETPAPVSPEALTEQSQPGDISHRMTFPVWDTLWVRLETRTYQPDGHYTTLLEEAWLDRDGGGRLLRSDAIADVENPSWMGATPRWAWGSDGLSVRQVDRQTGEETYYTQADQPWGEHPLENAQPMLFPMMLAIKSSTPQIVRADTWAGRAAVVVAWDGRLYWVDAETGLILRDAALDADGNILSETRVEAIVFNPALPAALAEARYLREASWGQVPVSPDFGAAASPLRFEFTPAGDSVVEGVIVNMDVYAQGYFLGTVETGAWPGGFCDRSADGAKLAFEYESIVDGVVVTSTLRWVDLGDLSNIHNDYPGLHLRSAVAWAPLGEQLAFQAMRQDHTEAGLYILDVAANQLQYIPFEQVSLWQPVWKPDGTQIAFVGSDGGAAYTLNIVDIASGEVIHSAEFDFPTWKPTAETPFTEWSVELPQENLAYARCLYPKSPVSIPAGMTQYVVQAGDSALSIASSFGISVKALHDANGLSADNALFVGQTLLIPAAGGPTPTPGESAEMYPYIVVEGDTIARIAAYFRITPEELLAANGLPAEGAQLFIGQTLMIPDPASTPTTASQYPLDAAVVASKADPTPPAGFFDVANSLPLHLEFSIFDNNSPSLGMDVYAQGDYLGSVEMGHPTTEGGYCDRSADGSKLAFVYEEYEANVIGARVTTSALRWVDLSDLGNVHNNFPDLYLLSPATWAPEGNRLAFTAMHADGTGEGLYILDTGTNQLQHIPSTAPGPWQPVWKPDGAQIAFLGSNGGAAFALNIADLASNTVTHTAEFDVSSWKPMGNTPFTDWNVTLPQGNQSFVRCLLSKVSAPPAEGMTYYAIQEGDTLNSIAAQFGIPNGELPLANGFPTNPHLYVGQIIVIPIPNGAVQRPAGALEILHYTVRAGDTPASIAAKFKIAPTELLFANRISFESATIVIGQKLVIPMPNNPFAAPTVSGVTIAIGGEQFVIVHAGPGSEYAQVGRLDTGTQATAVGKSPDGSWVQIIFPPVESGLAWVYRPYTDADPDTLPVITDIPPTPTPVLTPTKSSP